MTNPNEIIYTLAGLVFDKDGKVLLTLRQDDEIPAADHKWQLSGGEIEFGETAENCLIREFREETGCIIKPFRLINLLWSNIWENKKKDNKEQVIIIPFYCLLRSAILRSFDPEILDVRWFHLKEVYALETLPGVLEIIEYGQRYRGIEKKKGGFFSHGRISDF